MNNKVKVIIKIIVFCLSLVLFDLLGDGWYCDYRMRKGIGNHSVFIYQLSLIIITLDHAQIHYLRHSYPPYNINPIILLYSYLYLLSFHLHPLPLSMPLHLAYLLIHRLINYFNIPGLILPDFFLLKLCITHNSLINS